MKKLAIFFVFIFSFVFVNAQQEKIPFLKYEDVEAKIKNEKAELLIVNFWATTCAPCVKELPHFIEVNNQHKNNPNFKMLLVSLDRSKDLEKVKNFIKTKNITAEVVILDDNKRMNTWIPKFDANWQGEMPVTIFYKNGEKVHFQNGEMSKTELEQKIKQNL